MGIVNIYSNSTWIVFQFLLVLSVTVHSELFPDWDFKLPNDNCKKVHVLGRRGSIRSPNYPFSYRNLTSCTWYIAANPEEAVTISFNDLNIEEDSTLCLTPPCCNSNWVKIGHGHDQKHFCGQNGYIPPPLSIMGDVSIKFHTSHKSKGGRGFQLDYVVGSCLSGQHVCNSGTGCYSSYEHCNGHVDCFDFSDELGCGQCLANHTACSLASDFCYNPSTQRCDRKLDCPNGEDEQSCEDGCKGKISCTSGVGCYSTEERCNGVAQCGDASDEKNCNPELCRSERGGFLCGNKHCIREIWCCDRTNDCGDGTDEMNCLKNSVIAAAVIGSLICGLLLVVAISCSCKLYALRSMTNNMGARETPLSQLEREFMYREPPPSYAVATGDATMLYPDIVNAPGERRSSRHHGRSRSHRTRTQTHPRSFQPMDCANSSSLSVISPVMQQEEMTRRNCASANSCEPVEVHSSNPLDPSRLLSNCVRAKKHTTTDLAEPSRSSELPEDDNAFDDSFAWKAETGSGVTDTPSTSDLLPLLPS